MADYGHVKISRKFFADNPFWTEPREFSRAEAWLDLVQRAAWRPHRQLVKGTVLHLDRGELVVSLRYLSIAWGWGLKKVRLFIDLLLELKQIRAQRETHHGTVYLVVNYERYHSHGAAEDTGKGTDPEGAQVGHAEGTATTTEKGTEKPSTDAGSGDSGAQPGAQPENEKGSKRAQKRRREEEKKEQNTTAAEAAMHDGEFEEAWDAYPKRLGDNPRRRALKAWLSRRRAGVAAADLLAGVERYAAYVRRQGREGTEFVMQTATFFGPDERWAEAYSLNGNGASGGRSNSQKLDQFAALVNDDAR